MPSGKKRWNNGRSLYITLEDFWEIWVNDMSANDLLEKAAKTFRFYEKNHRAKNTEDSLKKAEVNAALAKEIEDFLTLSRKG